RAATGGGDLRDREGAQPQRARVDPARRAEHQHRAALRRLRLHPGERARGDGRRGEIARRQRGREGVLPRLLLRRPQELPRREVVPAPQAVALKKEHFDRLETRPAKKREAALMAELPRLIAHAKRRAPGFARILGEVQPGKIGTRKALAALPVTRKSELATLQKDLPPLGGLNATPVEQLGKLFISPGPIYDPEGRGKDWWRTARGLFAGGFRAGDRVLNTFAYHFTPAGSMLEAGAAALGCTVVPGGTGQTEMQVAAIRDLQINAFVGTPSFLKLIVEKADELKIDISSLRTENVGAEY